MSGLYSQTASTLCATLVLACSATVTPIALAASPATLELVADGLDQPTNLAAPPDGSGRLFVLEQYSGRVRVIRDGRLAADPALDLGDKLIADAEYEEGLLGIAFPPGFPRPAEVYVTYIGRAGDLVLSRFEVSGDAALPATEQILLSVARDGRAHHCGHITFDPLDGLLNLCVGDTENAPLAQDATRLQGKILSVEVDDAQSGPVAATEGGDGAMASPGDFGTSVRLLGLRNPWRFTFDPETGDLFVPDVGSFHWEELNVVRRSDPKRRNLGWPMAEGNECMVEEACAGEDLRWPVFEYASRDDRCSVIGGAVYRGERYPAWHGTYVFADYCSGEIWALRDVWGEPRLRQLIDSDAAVSAVGTGPDGEIVFADHAGGAVYRLSFPNDVADGWTDVRIALLSTLLRSKRSGFGWTQSKLEEIMRSERWRLSGYLFDFYRWLSSPFE